jgi:hypothetical protein
MITLARPVLLFAYRIKALKSIDPANKKPCGSGQFFLTCENHHKKRITIFTL